MREPACARAPSTPNGTSPAGRLAAVLAVALVMVLALPTEPLFFGNQNTKFLHGMAAAGYGDLALDWQANTKNGLPVFTWLVTLVMQLAGPWLFYVLQLGVFVAIAAALLAWHRRLVGDAGLGDALLWPTTLVLALLHSNQATAKLFQGVATQYIADRVLEPANIGFLLLAGALALHAGRAVLGAAALAAAAAVHPGYVLPAAVLLASGLIAYRRTIARRYLLLAAALGFGGLALNAWLLASAFPPTSPQLALEAARLLTDVRIPDHSHLAAWFDVDAAAKLAIVLLAIRLTWHQPLARFLALALLITAALTLISLAPDLATLRLIAPWRTSVALVPIALVVVLTYGLAWLMQRMRNKRPAAALTLVLTALITGVNATQKAQHYLAASPLAHHAWLRAHSTPGQVVLTPVRDRDFRLATGMAQYVSFQSHPYQDHEVIEWHRRIETARAIQAAPAASCNRLQDTANTARVSHVVWPAARVASAPCPFLNQVFRSDTAVVFALDTLP